MQNFFMNYGKIIGFSIIVILWLWLSWALLTTEKGFNLKNLFIVACSGIIIFVPLWKKYFRKDNNEHTL